MLIWELSLSPFLVKVHGQFMTPSSLTTWYMDSPLFMMLSNNWINLLNANETEFDTKHCQII